MDSQYDISPEMKALFEQKQKQRAEAKAYYQKLIQNPHRPISDGPPFDPAIVRFGALNIYRHTLYETNANFYFKFFLLTSPFLLTYLGLMWNKKSKEARFRSGLERYEDRLNKYLF